MGSTGYNVGHLFVLKVSDEDRSETCWNNMLKHQPVCSRVLGVNEGN